MTEPVRDGADRLSGLVLVGHAGPPSCPTLSRAPRYTASGWPRTRRRPAPGPPIAAARWPWSSDGHALIAEGDLDSVNQLSVSRSAAQRDHSMRPFPFRPADRLIDGREDDGKVDVDLTKRGNELSRSRFTRDPGIVD